MAFALAALAVLAVGLRALPWPLVAADGRLDPPEPDAYYHLRRIEYTVHRFPDVLDRDPYLRFPHGARVIWPPLFDGALGAAAVALGAETRAEVERVAAWAPPLLAALTVLAVALLAGRHAGPAGAGGAEALLAGGLLAVLPAHASYSRVGFVDHHVAVSLAFALLLLASAGLVARDPARGRTGWGLLALGLGLALGGVVALWPGALLHAGLVQASLTAWCLGAAARADARSRAAWLAAAHAVAAATVAPLGLGRTWERFGAFTPLVLSSLQPLWFAAGAAAFGGLAAAWRTPLGATRGRRVASGLAAGGVGLGIAFAAAPELASRLGEATGWFAKEEAFLGTVAELRPLLTGPGALRSALLGFGYLLALAPALLAGAAWLAWRRRRPALGLLVAVATGLGLATLLQQRFGNDFAVALAPVAGASLAAAARAAWRRVPPRTGTRVAAAVLAAGVAAALLAPVAPAYLPDARNALRALRGQPLRFDPWWRKHRARAQAAVWLGAHSPETDGWLDPDARPAWGVMTAWSDGHAFRYLARRPVVQDNFGVYGGRENWELAGRYYAALREEEALAIAARLRVRYVVARPTGSGHGVRYGPRALAARLLSPWRGDVVPLRHHRLVYASAPYPSGFGPRARPVHYGIWEIVPGARVAGRAEPGAPVTVRLPLRTARGHAFAFEDRVRADAAGRYELVLPYPTRPFGDGVAPAGVYRVSSGARSAPLAVPEAAVREGRPLPGPQLGPERPRPG